jgi:predicted ATP-grasp superfamily ATP-dependent carboligase
MKILLVGISTRFMAQSAAAAGYEVISLDFFGDRDQPPAAEVIALGRDLQRPLTVSDLASAALPISERVDGVMVVSGLENDPSFFPILGSVENAWNNPPAAVRLVRDVGFLKKVVQGSRVRFPETLLPGEPAPQSGIWVMKDLRKSGGSGVQIWDGCTPPGQGCVLQRYIPGALYSMAFAANGGEAVILGGTHQYAGVNALGAPPFAWCGNTAPMMDEELQKLLVPFVHRLVKQTGLRGINGIDFMVSEGAAWLLEVNPRPGASVELLERLYGFNAFQVHTEACQGRLPDTPIRDTREAVGKGIFYARRAVQVVDHPDWLGGGFADIPHPGEVIPAGAPICTLFETGEDARACWDRILARASAIEARPGYLVEGITEMAG